MGKQVQFAIRSGGHSPSPLAANINNGVLIDLANLNKVDYHAASGTVTVGAGNRWRAVYTALDPYNVTAVGGRVLDVGVGGFLLQSNTLIYPFTIGDGVLMPSEPRWSLLPVGSVWSWLR